MHFVKLITAIILIFTLSGFHGKNFSAPLNGTYSVGSGQSYSNISDAITALNTNGISGPVIFSLTDASYSFANNVAPNGTINSITGASSVNTITFKPASGVSPTITITANATQYWGINLNGADYIIIDGSNTANGTTKDLTITTTGANSYVLYLHGGASYNTIKNCNIKGYSNSSSNYGIYAADFSVNDEFNTVRNNTITKVYVGIYMQGIASPHADGNVISANTVGFYVASPDNGNINHVISKGIELSRQTNCDISLNEVLNIINTAGVSVDGIHARQSTNVVISRNFIHDILNTSQAVGPKARGLYLQTDAANPNTTIKNNFIYHVAASGTNGITLSTSVSGIHLQNVSATGTTSGINLFYNSIYMSLSNNTSPAGYDFGLYMTGNNTHLSSALAIENDASGTIKMSGINCKNNIFRNSLGKCSSGVTGGGQSYYFFAIATDHSTNPFADINNNDYDVSGTSTANIFFHVGSVNGTTKTFATWKTFTGQDANSVNTVPLFTSATNLYLNADCNRGTATSVGGITEDIDGGTRSATTPDIGADEYNEVGLPIELTSFSAIAENNFVRSNWTTANEINNDFLQWKEAGKELFLNKLAPFKGQETAALF